jgi:DNA modification methylase
MTYQLLQGDNRQVLRTLPDKSVHCIVTSPPYFGLRDYGVDQQIGLEETPVQYVAELVTVFRECWRVLRDDGTLWLNLGDSYAANRSYQVTDNKHVDVGNHRGMSVPMGLKPKDLIGIPWRVAFALQDDGWYLRSDIIWHKPNPMPESVTDRPTKAHEYIFLLTKSQRYYYDAEAVKEPATVGYNGSTFTDGKTAAARSHLSAIGQGARKSQDGSSGRNRRSVWTVATQPYAGAHFATFPPALIEPCILAGTSEHGVCANCGAPWERVVEREVVRQGNTSNALNSVVQPKGIRHGMGQSTIRSEITSQTTGWQLTCTCNADVVPATVLDPFNGSGTTGAVACAHGRDYIGIDLNADYIALAHDRIREAIRESGRAYVQPVCKAADFADLPMFGGAV